MSPHLPSSSSSSLMLNGRLKQPQPQVPPPSQEEPSSVPMVPPSTSSSSLSLSHSHHQPSMNDNDNDDTNRNIKTTTTTMTKMTQDPTPSDSKLSSSTTTTMNTSSTIPSTNNLSMKILSYGPLLHGLLQLQQQNTKSRTTTTTRTSTTTGISSNSSPHHPVNNSQSTASRIIGHWWNKMKKKKTVPSHQMSSRLATTTAAQKMMTRTNQHHNNDATNPSNSSRMIDIISTNPTNTTTTPTTTIKKRWRSLSLSDDHPSYTSTSTSSHTTRSIWTAIKLKDDIRLPVSKKRKPNHPPSSWSSTIATTTTTNNDHDHWVWNMWQSYSHQERWYATQILLQQQQQWMVLLPPVVSTTTNNNINHTTTTSSIIPPPPNKKDDHPDQNDDATTLFIHQRYEFIRRLIEYIHGYIHQYHDPSLYSWKESSMTTAILLPPNLTEWCATFQYVLSYGVSSLSLLPNSTTTTSTSTTSTGDENLVDAIPMITTQPQCHSHSNEIVAIWYHYWPWYCMTLWKLVQQRRTISSSQQKHVLAWIQMLYSYTIANVHHHHNNNNNTIENILWPVRKVLNQSCLWNTKLLMTSERSNGIEQQQQQQSQTPVEPADVSLSPLAHLIATYYRIKDNHHTYDDDDAMDIWNGTAMIEAQQLLGEMIHYRTTVRPMKLTTPPKSNTTTTTSTTTNTSITPPTTTATTTNKNDDATSASVKTTKTGNATIRSSDNPDGDRTSRRHNDTKDILIRFAENDDDDDDDNDDENENAVVEQDDHEVSVRFLREPKGNTNGDDEDVLDELQSIMMQSEHSSDNDNDDDENSIMYEEDNDTVSSHPKPKESTDVATTGVTTKTSDNNTTEKKDTVTSTTAHPNSATTTSNTTASSDDVNDNHPSTTTAATTTTTTMGDNQKMARRPGQATMTTRRPSRHYSMSRSVLETMGFGQVDRDSARDTTSGKDNDDDDDDDDHDPMPDDDDDDDEDDFVEHNDDDDDDDNDDDDDDNDGMDFAFIRDDSLHRYRTALEQQDKPDDEVDDGHDASEDQVVNSSTNAANGAGTSGDANGTTASGSKNVSSESENSSCVIERRKLYILASMQVLALQHPHSEPKMHGNAAASAIDQVHTSTLSTKYLSVTSENELIGSINAVVKPPTKPIVTKIVLRRAPTQEEFFRGSLTRNPVPVNMLLDPNSNRTGTTNDAKNSGGTTNSDREATVYDLRQYIANDLQMADSAELIEIIVANKILDVNLKIRVVQQVLWKKSLIENPNASSGISRDQHHDSAFGALLASSGGTGFFTSGSAMSFLISSSVGNSGSSHSRSSGTRVTADTSLAQLPPMIATYRLAGVDGEATEETVGVSDLIDPEAVSDTASSEEKDALLEAEFGMTRYVTAGYGVEPLLRSTQDFVSDILRRIRRDSKGAQGLPNPARLELKQCPPCQGLILLRYCAKLAMNRKCMLEARAPTILLALLIDILKTLEETAASAVSPSSNDSNPTTEILQELIELLTSDISSVGSSSKCNRSTSNEDDVEMFDNNLHNTKDASSMSLLLQSIETIALSSPLRIVVAKLLPFLTYGQPDLCRELALHFDKHINNETLVDWEISGSSNDDSNNSEGTKNSIMTNTFIQTALVLPANDVCDSLRTELINCRFIESIVTFITRDIPNDPAHWTPALWSVREVPISEQTETPMERSQSMIRRNESNTAFEESWRNYYNRPGVRTAFKVLIGLCRRHGPTQSRIAMQNDFIKVCHWLESTSDSTSVNTNGLGLLAETLLDEIILGNDEVDRAVKSVRNATRLRKKELAQEQRNRAIQKITSFGGITNIDSSKNVLKAQSVQANVRQGLASILAPVVGLFQSTSDVTVPSSDGVAKKSIPTKKMPSWFSEIEDMQDEVGLTCAVCQEGSTLQPSEMLGLYIYIKKISISHDRGGACSAIDGTNLLEALPSTLPDSLLENPQNALISEWFATTQSVIVNVLSSKSSKSSSSSTRHRQHASYTTSVTAGNGIHYSCHRRARQADRSHPKAPKTEWEGATLRNSRVNCNAILPLVHGPNQSKIPLVTMESALSDHSEIVSNLSGSSSPKSALWSVLHDLRLLLLRISHNESLSSDCGGGSLASNCQLIYHQVFLARLRDRNAAMVRYDHQSEHSMHAHGLAAGVLLATALANSDKTTTTTSSDEGTVASSVPVLTRHLADAAPMGALTSVVFPRDDEKDSNTSDASSTDVKASTSYHWNVGHDYFLQSLVVCAGRRHAHGLTGSGCTSSSGRSIDEEVDDDEDDDNDTEEEVEEDNDECCVNLDTENVCNANKLQRQSGRAVRDSDEKATLHCNDFIAQLRPMLTYYLILNQLHEDLTVGRLSDCDEDESNKKEHSLINEPTDPVEACVEQLVELITSCWKCRSVQELLSKLPKSSNNNECTETNVLGWFQQGMMSL